MMARDRLPTIALCLEYPILDGGGVSVIVRELACLLADEFRFVLVSPDREDTVITHLGPSPFAAHISYQMSALPPSLSYTRQARQLVGRLKEENTSIAHFHCGGTFGWGNRWPGDSIPELCKKVGIDAFWTDHLTATPNLVYCGARRPDWFGKLLSPLARAGKIRQMRAVDLEIAVSNHDQAFLYKHYGGNRVERIYHSRLDGAPPQPETSRIPVVLAVGHIAFRKGQDVLVRAFLGIAKEFPEWRLLLAGPDGGDGCQQEIERLIMNHSEGRRVELLGFCNRPLDLMRTASIFVQPSLEEALGLALQEAVFSGCPAIGSRTGGIPEVIDEGNTGILVPPGNVTSLSFALSRLMEDASLRDAMSKEGKDSIIRKGMTRSSMIEAHRKLYTRSRS